MTRYNEIVETDQIQKIAKALADARRREILEIIADQNTPGVHCNAIVERVAISQPTVSHHIKELAASGLIEIHPDGQFNRLTLRQDVLKEYFESMRNAFHLESPEI